MSSGNRSRPSSARPLAPKRTSVDSRSSRKRDEDIMYECKAAYLTIFDDVDEQITKRSQLSEALSQAGRNPTRKFLSKYWKQDTDSLSFSEFVDICRNEPATSEDDLMKAFRKIDLNGDGYVDNGELKKVLTTRGEKMSTAEVQAIIDDVDENQDGRLDYKEFCKMVLDTQSECKRLAVEHMEKKLRSGGKGSLKSKNDYDAESDTTLDAEPQENGEQTDGKEEATKTGTETSPKEVDKTPDEVEPENIKEEINEETQDEPKATDPPEESGTEEAQTESKTKHPQTEYETKNKQDEKPESDESDDDVIMGTSRSSTSERKGKLGSMTSLRSEKSERRRSSTASTTSNKNDRSIPPKPRPRPRSSRDRSSGVKPSPRVKERTKSPIAGKDFKLPKPKRLKDWNLTHSKGCFFFDDDNVIVGHQYEMKLSKDTSVWITIEPFSIRPGSDLNSAHEVSRSPVDTMLVILRDDNSLVTITEQRDVKGRYGVRCDLERGRYKLIPFTTGCRLKPRTSEPSTEAKLVKKTNDKYVLTKAFKEALGDIFELCDLDGNGSLSRSEFNFFNLRASGESVNDSEWEVVEDKLELKDGEITRSGFIELNQMEAEDNQGDTEELWVTPSCMGFNKSLNMDESCPFFMEIYSESCEARLSVTNLKEGSKPLQQAIVDATMGKGESNQIANMRDLLLHTYMNDFRASLVIENKSNHSVRVRVDSSRSDNAVASTPGPEHTVDIPSRTSMIVQHLMPAKETREWTVRTQERILK